MQLISLEIKNFRQFYGEHRIEFARDKNKNITLIHAENGAGKTALLNAIRWCLHESFTSNFPDSDKLINNHWKEEGRKDFSVRLEFEEENDVFAVIRGVENDGRKYFLVHEKNAFGEFKNITQDYNLFINSIIPKEMANYFFFQGEGVGRVAGVNAGKGVKEAIHEILGFSLAKQAIKDLKDIDGEYLREISKLDTTNSLMEDKRRALENCLKSIDELEAFIDRKKEEIDLYNAKVKEIDNILSNSNHLVIREKQKQRNQNEANLTQAKLRLELAKKHKLAFIRDYGYAVFAHSLASQALDFINESELKGRVPAPYNKQLITDILQQRHCICGTEVTLGSEAYAMIESMLQKAGDPNLQNRVSKARAQLSELKRNSTRAKSKYSEVLDEEMRANADIDELTKIIETLSKEILHQDYTDEEINAHEKNRADYNKFAQQANKDLGGASKELQNKNKLKNNLTDEITRIQGNSPQLEKFKQLQERATAVIRVINEKLQRSEREMPAILISKINKFLSKFVRQDYKAKIDHLTYDIAMFDEADRRVAMSDGQSLLLSLTFISSLIELARERKNVKNEILTPGAIAPFVIDAPFGDLDNTYKANVARTIPETVDQVVFLLSSSHWEGLVEGAIRQRVGAEYTLQVEVVGSQGDKTVDSIVIDGQQYPSVVYGKDIPRTNIIRIM